MRPPQTETTLSSLLAFLDRIALGSIYKFSIGQIAKEPDGQEPSSLFK
jgi:hypothetical protein